MQDAFGVDRSDISKGMKPSKVCERCGGKIDMKTGKCTKCGTQSVSKGFNPANIASMENSASSALRARGAAARYGKEAAKGAKSMNPGARMNSAGLQQQGYRARTLSKPASTGGSKMEPRFTKLAAARRSGQKFGAANPVNQAKSSRRSGMASLKSRTRANLGMTSY